MTTSPQVRRHGAPEPPSGEIRVEAPPSIPEAEPAGDLLTTVVPVLGSVGSVVVMATMGSASSAGQLRTLIAAGLFLIATLGFAAAQVDRHRMRRIRAVTGARASYLRHLDCVRRAAREAGAQQRAARAWHHPPPATLPALSAEGSRVWERHPGDREFLQVRYASSTQASTRPLVPQQRPASDPDPVGATSLQRLLTVHTLEPDLPVTADLQGLDLIEVGGPSDAVRALARSLICAASAAHAPDHLRVAVLAPSPTLGHWEWVKWLPHARSPGRVDAVGARRLVASELGELRELLSSSADADHPPHLLLVVDDLAEDTPTTAPPRGPHTSVVLLSRRPGSGHEQDRRLRLSIDDAGGLHPASGDQSIASADSCDVVTAEAVARRLATRAGRAPASEPEPPGPLGSARPLGHQGVDLVQLLGFGDIRRLDPTQAWRRRSPRDHLRVPIGVGDGSVVELDLKESAQHGVGPHGLLVGATGSGKSELLRTLVLGLALTHSPERLSLVLVDFKGGATFAGLSDLPHVSALITNLADDPSLVERAQDALAGELVRRQEMLRDAGGLASAHDYERARSDGADLEPLPSLFIVVDEFSELLGARPEFLDLLLVVGRLGRSLGLHLLVASQRLEEGRLGGLESHLSYRIGLRTFSAQESRAVLGVPDAHTLPTRPGAGLLRTGPETLVPFSAAYVSGPPISRPRHAGPGHHAATEIRPWTAAEVAPGAEERPLATPRHAGSPVGDTLLSTAVARMRACGPRARRIWLPPLATPTTLDELIPGPRTAPRTDPASGPASTPDRARGGLSVPIGVVDRPREQRRDPLLVDLAAAGGHVAVVGAPGSGKSTLLRTLIAGLALTATPRECQVYVLDAGGGTCAGLRGLPHVAGVASASEPDVVRRILAEVGGHVARREALFADHDLDSMEAYRRRRQADGPAGLDDRYGDVVLVVDGWGMLRRGHDDLDAELQALATRGSAYGVHLVAAAARWADLRPAVRDLFGTRLELRLGDPVDSEVDRRLAATVPRDRPGRGLTSDGAHFLGALPRIDGDPDPASLAAGVADLMARVASAWPGPTGPKLRLLPALLPLGELRSGPTPPPRDGLLIGLDETGLSPVTLDPAGEPHLLVLGDGGSGKSSALRAYLHEVMRVHGPRQAQLVVVDYRRALLGEVPEDHLLHYLTSAGQALPALTDLARHLQQRLPGPAVTPEQLRGRSWWSGADVFVVVDDYDLVAGPQGSPVEALVPLLAQARDVGLHLVLARRTGGAARAMFEPVIQALRELSAPGLVLSGSPEEGVLLGGVRPAAAPPGRGRLVTRDRGVEVVQIAWQEPAH